MIQSLRLIWNFSDHRRFVKIENANGQAALNNGLTGLREKDLPYS